VSVRSAVRSCRSPLRANDSRGSGGRADSASGFEGFCPAETSRSEAQTNFDAAQGRREAGVATIADVLQSKTALSQATLITLTIAGSIGSLRGALATAMGIPANVPFDVEDLPAEVPSIELSSSVDQLIERAKTTRPDLASSREDWLAAKADIKTARGAWLPKLAMTGAVNRNSYTSGDFSGSGTPWSLGVVLRIPVFDGLRAHYAFEVNLAELRRAEKPFNHRPPSPSASLRASGVARP
jgi:outer membrane protein TolC